MTTDSSRKVRVALVFGGRSSEHPVSCATAAGVMAAIDKDRFEVIPIGIAKDGRWVLGEDDLSALSLEPGHLPEVPDGGNEVRIPLAMGERTLSVLEPGQPPRDLGGVDVVFPLLHGPFGEDGTIQGLMELADLPYVGSGVLASAAMMDKHFMKGVFTSHGLPVGPFVTITDRQWRRDPQAALASVEPLGYPVFVKPARAGSSVGITRVRQAEQLRAAIELAREHDPKVVVEAAIFGREIECGVLESRDGAVPRISEPGEIAVERGHDFYDFDAKYLASDGVRLSCPADLPEQDARKIKAMASEAFEAAGCEGLARVDFFYTPDRRIILNEINTMPGFTPHSMFPQVWQASGMSYPQLISELIDLALERKLGLR
ncbi:D-alanine--D-alanine ligase family protein [Gephyromycinifex aptenodytis]|uniref:D-alanine--D-alanine ligase family protein n=1 Tax=Gephyromycinifex aptenodytis TaxID=2716227 RepID=UPI0014469ABC|nr:D-alanine--D-alanine ligase family protein [Gephyromycinifex aptenodytis]